MCPNCWLVSVCQISVFFFMFMSSGCHSAQNLLPTFCRWTHLSRRLRNQNPLLGVTSIFPLRLTDCLATPKSQSVFSPTSTCLRQLGQVCVLSPSLFLCWCVHRPRPSSAPYLPVVFPGGNSLPSQHAQDSVKSFHVVGQQLVLIPTTHLPEQRTG